jgi:transcriptional regulator with XRE-family HTH domain
MNFGEALRSSREEVGLLQAELAAKADLNVAYVSRLENNKKSPTLTVYARICDALGISPTELMRRVEAASAVTPPKSRKRRR